MAWDYAQLSHLAKMNGGPEALIDTIEMAARATGRKEMIPVVIGALALGVGATILVQKVKKFLDGEASVSPKAVAAAKEELIAGIENYDREHPDEGAAMTNEGTVSDER